jgi:hypothetical protein
MSSNYIYIFAFIRLLSVGMLFSLTVRADWSKGLTAQAVDLVQNGRIHLTGDISCEYGSGDGASLKAYDGNDAIALLRVASQRRIYLFAHGFYPNPRRHKPPTSYAYDTWNGHLEMIRRMGAPYSACLFLSDTVLGFGDHQPLIGDFLFALRALTDDPELFLPSRVINLVGYSAGANYMKHALVRFQKHLALNTLSPQGIASTWMNMVFFAGVHNGTSSTLAARAGVMLVSGLRRGSQPQPETLEQFSEQRWNEYLQTEQEALVNSKGAQQLSIGSEDLAHLNRQFQGALTPNIQVVNIGSITDIVAPRSAFYLSYTHTQFIDGLSHSDFVGSPLPSPLAKAAAFAYTRSPAK